MAEEKPRTEICDSTKDPIQAATERVIVQSSPILVEADRIQGFTSGGEKIKVLQVFVGYTDEQMQSAAFHDAVSRDSERFETIMGAERFDIGYYNRGLNIEITQQGRLVYASNTSDREFLNEAVRKHDPHIDMIQLRINPDLVDSTLLKNAYRFGAAHVSDLVSTATGPNLTNPDDEKHVHACWVMAHEAFHTIGGLQHYSDFFVDALDSVAKATGLPVRYPARHPEIIEFEDSYSHTTYSFDEFDKGSHSELTLAPSIDQLDAYYPEGTMPQKFREILKQIRPEIEDVGYQCSIAGKAFPVYAFNKGIDIMEGSGLPDSVVNGDFSLNPFTPLQRALMDSVTKDYLIEKGRMEPSPRLQHVQKNEPSSHGLPVHAVSQTRGGGIID